MGRRAAAVALVALLLACEGAYLTAPPGSTLVLVAAPTSIPAHGGVSELTAVVTESIGTAVPDGTVVFWSTSLGRVDRETRTNNGIARNRLVSDSRSGVAFVVAVSGGGTAPGPVPGPSPSASPTTSTTTATTTLAPGPSGQASDTAEIHIGNILVETVLLRAVPSRITISQTTHLIATVLDAAGNPVPNVPVFFEIITDLDRDSLDSGGAARHTNNNGEAEDVLRTRRTGPGGLPIRVRAVAASEGGFEVESDPLTIPFL